MTPEKESIPANQTREERQYADINAKLRSLTREQANQLGAHLNSVYIRAEEDRKVEKQ